MPLALVGILIIFFLVLEARRYRYFNVWRARARWLETHFYAPMLSEGDLHLEEDWQTVLAEDYLHPRYHVSYMVSVGRRIRRNYLWLLLIQSLAYGGKLTVHPTPATSVQEALSRADTGPIPGEVMVGFGFLYIITWCCISFWSYTSDQKRAKMRGRSQAESMG